ncbi:unnamed protein product [Darwinula stevensoni]|uniref:TLC domain-containing protein n=1 Tax=Darwinula stevensoni TaxID=69355 RepID=A0A7R9ACX6_9CRUS|nr:unnamed protein product [Darwinula stevensoni]CAG0900776.1 unnamed protein product [Darwinula stevensoni]
MVGERGARWLEASLPARPSSKKRRFAETGVRFVMHALVLGYGVWATWGEPWMGQTRLCWQDLPFHILTGRIWWYYMLELGFYCSMILAVRLDVRRKDFWMHVLHHFVVVVLLAGSWTLNITRLGSLILLVHDAADPILMLAKLFHYLGKTRLCIGVYILFTAVWLYSRVYYFPVQIVFISTREKLFCDSGRWRGNIPTWVLLLLLYFLLCLHVIWTYLILQALVVSVVRKKPLEDRRSDASDADGDKED